MSQDIFKKYEALQVYYKTADGQPFFQESDARNHAKTLDNKKVETVERPIEEIEGKTTKEVREYAINAKDSIALIKEATTVEALEVFADDERKSVVEAYAKKFAELNESTDDLGSVEGSDETNKDSEDETKD
ncbi:hypothetical protein [Empedobacter sp. GD03797]|uniref:hypothetical protein n=1 Tax=Empedobacter sp. GD03797 TaxID=2975382 RepID=UPI00244B71B2|nr:hypothetical protein [Empedobacter sp. GD03797]MDH1880934.1 hypothetical protein [Empedobacter sp. GD03797]